MGFCYCIHKHMLTKTYDRHNGALYIAITITYKKMKESALWACSNRLLKLQRAFVKNMSLQKSVE